MACGNLRPWRRRGRPSSPGEDEQPWGLATYFAATQRHRRLSVLAESTVAVAGLRAMGLARYVSGYLETTPPPGRPRMVGADASHAWASVCTGTDWLDLDPTNDQLADASYVELAHGRDYADVPPLKGVIFADSTGSVMDVAVDMIRVDRG